MTADDIRAAVEASPQLCRLATAGNVAALTVMLRLHCQTVQAGEVITARGAAARFSSIDNLPGPLAFEAAIGALEAFVAANADSADVQDKLRARAIGRVLEVFPALGLDFGDPALRASLDTLAEDVLTQAQIDAFKGLARVQMGQVTEAEVRQAIGVMLPEAPT